MNYEEVIWTREDNVPNAIDDVVFPLNSITIGPEVLKIPGGMPAKIETLKIQWAVEVAGGDRVTIEASHFVVISGALVFFDDGITDSPARAIASGEWKSIRKVNP